MTSKGGVQKHIPIIGGHGRDESSVSSTGELSIPNNRVADSGTCESQQRPVLALQKHAHQDDVKSTAALDITSNLPDDSGTLFEFSCLQQTPSINEQDITNGKTHQSGSVISPEELSLCYLDPQGAIQGPFLGIDILLWFEQGFFGTDLPVRLSDAPEGSPFQELGDVMPHLKIKSGSASGSNMISESEPTDNTGRNLKVNARSPDFDVSASIADQPWVSSQSDATLSVGIHSLIPNQSYGSEINFSDDQCFTNFVEEDDSK